MAKKNKKEKAQNSKIQLYETYPLWIVLVYNIAMLLVYISGLFILFTLHLVMGILFLIYILIMEFSVYREGCRHCYYYGKRCVAGKGSIAPFLVSRGSPKKFCERELKFKDFIPQLLVVIIPIMIGIALLISRGFNIWILIAMIYPILSWFIVNPIVYGKLACPHCKQGKICCPALKFFSKKK